MNKKSWLHVTLIKQQIFILLFICGYTSGFAQLKLGANPNSISKASVLELESNRQGLLFPRIPDTTQINALNPADGMVIFFTPSYQLLVRSGGYWKPVATGTVSAGTGIGYNSGTGVISNTGVVSVNGNTGVITIDSGYIANFYQKVRSLFSAAAPITYSNGQLGITQSTTSTNGYLSSTDWNTFNNKVATTRTISTTGPLLGGGDLSANRTLSIADAAADGTSKGAAAFSAADFNATTGIISIDYTNATAASSTAKGFLTAADWNTFNNKVAATRTISTTGPLLGGGDLSANRTLSIADAAADGTTKGAATFSATDFNAATGFISIDYTNAQPASSTTKGFLTSADWNTFNNKANVANVWSVTGNTGTNSGTNFIGTSDNRSLSIRTNNTQRVYIDSTTGNTGLGTATPASKLEVIGSAGFNITTTTGNITLNATHYTVILNGTASVTLPAASTCARRIYVIVNRTASNRTITSYMAFTGTSTTVPATSSITLQSDGTNWYRIH